MDQDATWYIGLCPGDIVLDGDQASNERGTVAPTFRPTLLWHGRPCQQPLSFCWYYYYNNGFIITYKFLTTLSFHLEVWETI